MSSKPIKPANPTPKKTTVGFNAASVNSPTQGMLGTPGGAGIASKSSSRSSLIGWSDDTKEITLSQRLSEESLNSLQLSAGPHPQSHSHPNSHSNANALPANANVEVGSASNSPSSPMAMNVLHTTTVPLASSSPKNVNLRRKSSSLLSSSSLTRSPTSRLTSELEINTTALAPIVEPFSNVPLSTPARTARVSSFESAPSASTKSAKSANKTKSESEMSKEDKKKLKAERRAQAKVVSGKPSVQTALNPVLSPPSSKSRVGDVRQVPAHMRQDDPRQAAKTQKSSSLVRKPAQKPVPLFSHLIQYEKEKDLVKELRGGGLIHPEVLRVGLMFSEFVIAGGNARCVAMLSAFKKVIQDYVTPAGTTLSRHLTSHISKQVDFLSNMRSLAASMKIAIRFLKTEISKIDINLPDEDAKAYLISSIDSFIRDRITLAGQAIVGYGLQKINNGDVILTYAKSSVVLSLLLEAKKRNVSFRVIVADGRTKFEGKETVRRLVAANIPCTYILLSSSGYVMKEVTKVFMGASALLSNGAVMSRVGTSILAMMAYDSKVPVIVCCETYKFSENVRLDAVVWNEIGDPDELVSTSSSQRHYSFLPSTGSFGSATSVNAESAPPVTPHSTSTKSHNHKPLLNWRDLPNVKLLNLYYDVTPSKFVTLVISEVGLIPSTSAATVLRDYRSLTA